MMTVGAAQPKPLRRVGRYALYHEIASGGMATVYIGRQQGQAGFARTVAIKRLHPQFAKEPDFVSMFIDEARLAARISHPTVVPTLDVVATEGELFLVMEYVQGESLSRLLRTTRERGELVSTRVVAAIVADLLHGLHAAHEAKSERGEALHLVHRDVSPHNVLVGIDGVARVFDFGVAKATDRIQTTRDGQLKGKIAYMAPEQITGSATRRTDVYASSVILWEALTGRRLFAGENDVKILSQVINSELTRPSQHVPGLDPAWDDITLRGLHRDEAQRFPTAREMALEIERRFSVARATEVGAWVESLAGEALARRAAEVSAVERASDVEPALADKASEAGAESTETRLSAVSRAGDARAGAHAGRRRTLAVAGMCAGALSVAAILAVRSGSHPSGVASAASSGHAAMSAPSADTTVALPSTAPASSTADTPSSAPSSAPAAIPLSSRSGNAAPPRPRTPKPASLDVILDKRR